MKFNCITCVCLASLIGGTAALLASCIGEELPNINVDVLSVTPAITGSGVVKTTLQENGVTVYADMQQADLSNLPLDIEVTPGATSYFVDVKMETTYQTIEYGGQTYTLENVDTLITRHDGPQTDFSETRYIKVLAEAEGLNPKDWKTPQTFSKFGGIDAETGKLFKIWSIQVLPANLPTRLDFDKWYNPYGRAYQHPYEMVTAADGSQQQINIWASTNNSLGILLSTLYGANLSAEHYGTSPTTDAVSGKALKLCTKDISLFDQNKPFVTGCMFIGEFDGTDNDALSCTHVGLPFDKKPLRFRFSYKFHPGIIPESTNPASKAFAGQTDKGFIKAVLYRADENVPYLTGKTIQDNSFANTVAYAEYYPDHEVGAYETVDLPFTYTHNTEFSEEDMKNWKYNLAIYFASSKEGFSFVGSGETVLYIDDVEIVCE